MTAAASGVERLETRWNLLALAGEAAWLIRMGFDMLQTTLVAIFPWQEATMGTRVDIPMGAAKALLKLGIHMDIGTAATLDYRHYMPATGYYAIGFLMCITAFAAALQGRWILLFSLFGIMLLPPTLFGAPEAFFGGSAIFAGVLAIGRCIMKRQHRLILPIVVAACSVMAWHAYILADSEIHPTLIVKEKMDAQELQTLANLDGALSQLHGFDGDVAYVRAQIAYIRKDKAALKAIGPVTAGSIEATPYRDPRIRVLNMAIAQIDHPPTGKTPVSDALRIFNTLLLLPVFLFLFLTYRLRWRIRKIAKMAVALEALPPLRIAPQRAAAQGPAAMSPAT